MGFFDILLHPRPTMQTEVAKATLGAAIKTFAIYAAVFGVIFGLLIALILGAVGAFLGPFLDQIPVLSFFAGLGLAAIIVVPIINIIVTIIGGFIVWGIYWIIAKILGGTGTFTQNYFLASRLVWPMLVLQIIVLLIGLIPLLGFLVMILWILYSIYLNVILLSVANNMSSLRAFLVWLVPIILLFILLFVLTAGAIFAINPSQVRP